MIMSEKEVKFKYQYLTKDFSSLPNSEQTLKSDNHVIFYVKFHNLHLLYHIPLVK